MPATAVLWLAGGALGVSEPLLGFAIVASSLVLTGLLEGPLSIGMFTMRQRRTDPAWFGRAFAISMALNTIGFPIGAALAGGLAEVSIDLAILVGVIASIAATVFAAFLIPRRDEPPGHEVAMRALGSMASGPAERARSRPRLGNDPTQPARRGRGSGTSPVERDADADDRDERRDRGWLLDE